MMSLEQAGLREQGTTPNKTSELFSLEVNSAPAKAGSPREDKPSREDLVWFLRGRMMNAGQHLDSSTMAHNKLFGGPTPEVFLDTRNFWNNQSPNEPDKLFLLTMRHFFTFKYLDIKNTFGPTISPNQFDNLYNFTADSKREEIIDNCVSETPWSLGYIVRPFYSMKKAREACTTEFDTKIKPEIQRLLNDIGPADSEIPGGVERRTAEKLMRSEGGTTYELNGDMPPETLEKHKQGFPHLDAAARTGNAQAQYEIGQLLAESKTIPVKNFVRAVIDYYDNAARNGDALAAQLSTLLKQGRRNEVAAEWFRKAAEQGNLRAQEALGQIVKGFDWGGRSVTPLSQEAQQRYVARIKEWSNQGEPTANVVLGELYELGAGVPKNGKEAEKLYRKAATSGNKVAQLHLGMLYYDGELVPKDLVESAKWFKQAGDVVTWQISQIYNNSLGRGLPVEVLDKIKAEEPPQFAKHFDTGQRPYDGKIIDFAKRAAGIH